MQLEAADARPAVSLGGHTVSLRTNFAWTFLGNAAYAGSQWAVLVVIARLSNEAAVGKFALAYAVTAPIFLLAGLQLRTVQGTDAAAEFRFADYLGLTLATVAAAMIATLALVLFAGFDRTTSLVVVAVAASKAVECITEAHLGPLQRLERMRPIAVSLMCRAAFGMLALAAVLWTGGGLVLGIVALGLGWSGVVVLQTIPATVSVLREGGERYAPTFRWATVRRLGLLAFPLGAVAMMGSLRTNVPRYFIEHQIGSADLGVFAALSSLVIAGNLVVLALAQSASPRLARYHHEGRTSEFRALLARLLGIALLIGAAGIAIALLAGRPLLTIIFGARYARVDVLAWLMVAGLVSYVTAFLGTAVTSARQFRVQLPLFAVTTGVSAAACALLVPRHGLVGAAWGWGIALLAEAIALVAILAQTLRRKGAEA